jgi:hypothetical protein
MRLDLWLTAELYGQRKHGLGFRLMKPVSLDAGLYI